MLLPLLAFVACSNNKFMGAGDVLGLVAGLSSRRAIESPNTCISGDWKCTYRGAHNNLVLSQSGGIMFLRQTPAEFAVLGPWPALSFLDPFPPWPMPGTVGRWSKQFTPKDRECGQRKWN
jgi:hypothetical protein